MTDQSLGFKKSASVSMTSGRSIVATDVMALAVSKDFDLMANFTPQPGHIYTVTRAISARINQNFDGFPSHELKAAYKTFLGKPVFVNHANDDPTRARGRVVGARYAEAGEDKYIEVIQEVNAVKYPKLAAELEDGGLDSVSMGCVAAVTVCSFCGNEATDLFDMCEHIMGFKGQYLGKRDDITGEFKDTLVWEECRKIGFFELSYVFDPADETAMMSNVFTANTKKAFGEIVAPERIDTLRDEEDDEEDHQYVSSPPELSDPDLAQSKNTEHPDDSQAEDLHPDESDDKKEARMSTKTSARRKQAATGYVCKQCGSPSPMGVGYAVDGEAAASASEGLSSCSCGYSQKPTTASRKTAVTWSGGGGYDTYGGDSGPETSFRVGGDLYFASVYPVYDNPESDEYPAGYEWQIHKDGGGYTSGTESRTEAEAKAQCEVAIDRIMNGGQMAKRSSRRKTADWKQTDFSQYGFEPDYDVWETTLPSGYGATIKAPIPGRGTGPVTWGIDSGGLSIAGGSTDSVETAMMKAEEAGVFYTIGKRNAGNGTRSAQEKMSRRRTSGGKDMSRSTRTRRADQSRNDQGEQEEAFITQTPPAEPVETAEGEEINNEGKNHVAFNRFRGYCAALGLDLRTASVPQIRRAARSFSKQASVDVADLYPRLGSVLEAARSLSASDDDEGPTGKKADDDAKNDAKKGDDDDKKEARREALRRRAAQARTAKDDDDLPDFIKEKKDDKDDDDSDDKKSDDDKKKESKRRVRSRQRQADSTFSPGDKVMKSGYPGTVVSEYMDGMYEVRLGSGMVVVPGSELIRVSHRKSADSAMEVAAPDGRVDVERPTADTTDDEAQASQFDKGDFGNNAGDDLADPDLSTDQNWAPGEGKKTSGVVLASAPQAMQLAEQYISLGLNKESEKYNLVEQFSRISRATARDRIALLERVMEAAPARQTIAGTTRGSHVRSSIPRNMSAAVNGAVSAPRTASTDTSIEDSIGLFG